MLYHILLRQNNVLHKQSYEDVTNQVKRDTISTLPEEKNSNKTRSKTSLHDRQKTL